MRLIGSGRVSMRVFILMLGIGRVGKSSLVLSVLNSLDIDYMLINVGKPMTMSQGTTK